MYYKNIFRYIKNFLFCLIYPAWRFYNWNYNSEEYNKLDYSTTWYDSIPYGWRKAFGKQMCKDLNNAFKLDKKENPKLKWKNAIHWEQIKEKYGGLRLYASATCNIMKVLEHYEEISTNYCICCGKKAEYMSRGWIEFYCEKCFVENNCKKYDSTKHSYIPFSKEEIEKYKKECKL